MKKVIYEFYTPKEKEPPVGMMLLLNCTDGMWIGTYAHNVYEDGYYQTEAGEDIENDEVISWAILQKA